MEKRGRAGCSDWAAHVRAAERAGVSIYRYAREHRVSAWSMYAARRELRKAQTTRSAPAEARGDAFVRVALVAPQVRSVPVRAVLTNGVRVELDPSDPASLSSVLAALAELPCSV